MYGKGPKRGELLRRSLVLTRIPTPSKANPIVLGRLTDAKIDTLQELRNEYLTTTNQLVERVWQHNPIRSGFRDKKQLDKELGLVRKEYTAGGLHSVYAEKTKLAAQTAIFEAEKRLWRRVSGRLAFVDKKIKRTPTEASIAVGWAKLKNEPLREYASIPTSVQNVVNENDFSVLKGLANDKTRISLALTHPTSLQLSPTQIIILEYCVDKALEKYTQPVFGKDERFVCRIDIDYRLVKGYTKSEKYHQLLSDVNDQIGRLLYDDTNKLYTTFLSLTPPRGGGDIKIPLLFHARAFNKAKNEQRILDSKISSITLEIGAREIVVRGVSSKPTPKFDTIRDKVTVVGCDPGLVNAMTISAWTLPAIVQGLELEKILNFNKKDAFDYLTNHDVPQNMVESLSVPVLKKADKFRESINKLCERIENYSSRIDKRYDIIESQALELKKHLGLGEEELVNPKQTYNDPKFGKLHYSFFLNLETVNSWKKERRDLYRRIREKKKHWYGFLGNIIVKYMKSLQDAGHQVVFACEKYTGTAIEKTDPKYKGRVFNKRLSQSSLCSETQRLVAKIVWNGIPSYSIPSFYRSSFCSVCWRYDPKARQREQYYCSHCNSIQDADKNAADLYAKYLCDTAPTNVGSPALLVRGSIHKTSEPVTVNSSE